MAARSQRPVSPEVAYAAVRVLSLQQMAMAMAVLIDSLAAAHKLAGEDDDAGTQHGIEVVLGMIKMSANQAARA